MSITATIKNTGVETPSRRIVEIHCANVALITPTECGVIQVNPDLLQVPLKEVELYVRELATNIVHFFSIPEGAGFDVKSTIVSDND